MKRTCILICTALLCMLASCDLVPEAVDFEDLTLEAESCWNGSDGSAGFTSHDVSFNNYYDDTYGPYWEGFAYSNITDTTVVGYEGQYNAVPGGSVNGGSIYGVGYIGFMGTVPTVTFPDEQVVSGAYVTNDTYAFYAMRDGDAFAKQFEEGDWFTLTIEGKDSAGSSTGTVDVSLADGTSIADDWTWVSLGSLGAVRSLEFTLSSSDTGDFGMNTPAYFCIDDLNGIAP